MSQDESTPSTRPYLIRALHEWCTDNGFTPYIAVRVDDSVQVPREYVNDGEIVLNVGFDATSSLQLGNDYIEFKARFGGVARDIIVPITHVVAIYARENGQGMAFPPPPTAVLQASPAVGLRSADAAPASDEGKALQLIKGEDGGVSEAVEDDTPPPSPPTGSGRPALKRVK